MNLNQETFGSLSSFHKAERTCTGVAAFLHHEQNAVDPPQPTVEQVPRGTGLSAEGIFIIAKKNVLS